MGRVTITIHIDYADGAGVTVGSPQSSAAPPPADGLEEAPWPTSPADPPAGGVCPVHGLPWKTVPAGVSKSSGKPYAAFQACPERGCNEKPR